MLSLFLPVKCCHLTPCHSTVSASPLNSGSPEIPTVSSRFIENRHHRSLPGCQGFLHKCISHSPAEGSGLVTHRISPCVYFLGGWGSRINPIYHYNLPKPLGNFLYGKVSQSQHYGYFGLDYSSLWRTVLCILNVQLHPWPLTTRCQGAHPPPLWQSKMSPAIARVPWWTKLPRCSLPHKYTKEFLLFH